ncbi:hypothetical protein TWF696_005574 [Orbilia brochopaga]|uniref:Ras-GEF domain-containing protein n=1 Tax=Orbilia brochopaga TaxID=3140254 RepID=A0AAV9V7R4_9PEZI
MTEIEPSSRLAYPENSKVRRQYITACSILENIPPSESHAQRRENIGLGLPQESKRYKAPKPSRLTKDLHTLSNNLAFLLKTDEKGDDVAVAITGVTIDKVRMFISCDVLEEDRADDARGLRIRQARIEKHMHALFDIVQRRHGHSDNEKLRLRTEFELISTQITYSLKMIKSRFQDLSRTVEHLKTLDLSHHQFEPSRMTNALGTKFHVPPLPKDVYHQDSAIGKRLKEIYLLSSTSQDRTDEITAFFDSKGRLRINHLTKQDFIVWHTLFLTAFDSISSLVYAACEAQAKNDKKALAASIVKLFRGLNLLMAMTGNSRVFRQWASVVQEINLNQPHDRASTRVENVSPDSRLARGPHSVPHPASHAAESPASPTSQSPWRDTLRALAGDFLPGTLSGRWRTGGSPSKVTAPLSGSAETGEAGDQPKSNGSQNPQMSESNIIKEAESILPDGNNEDRGADTGTSVPPKDSNSDDESDTPREILLENRLRTSNEIFIKISQACAHVRAIQLLLRNDLVARLIPRRTLSLEMVPTDLDSSFEFEFEAENLSESLARMLYRNREQDNYSASERAEKFIAAIPKLVRNQKRQNHLLSLHTAKPTVKAVYHAETLLLDHVLHRNPVKNWHNRCFGISRQPCLSCEAILQWYDLELFQIHTRSGDGRTHVVAIPRGIPMLHQILPMIYQLIVDTAEAEVQTIYTKEREDSAEVHSEIDDSYLSSVD